MAYYGPITKFNEKEQERFHKLESLLQKKILEAEKKGDFKKAEHYRKKLKKVEKIERRSPHYITNLFFYFYNSFCDNLYYFKCFAYNII